MKKFLIPLVPLLASPLAAQAELQNLADEDLAAIHGQGSYSLKAGQLNLYTLDASVLGGYGVGPVRFSSVYEAVNDRNPGLVDTARETALNAGNAALAPVNVALQAQFATIPVFGTYLSQTFTPVRFTFTPAAQPI